MDEYIIKRRWDQIYLIVVVMLVVLISDMSITDMEPKLIIILLSLAIIAIAAIVGVIYLFNKEIIGIVNQEELKIFNILGINIDIKVSSIDKVLLVDNRVCFSLKDGSTIKITKEIFRKKDIKIITGIVP